MGFGVGVKNVLPGVPFGGDFKGSFKVVFWAARWLSGECRSLENSNKLSV